MTFFFQRSYRGPLQAIVFDWAGTTVDYGCYAPAKVFVQVFEHQGVPVTMAEARGPMGVAKKDHIRQMAQMESVQARWQEVHSRLPTEDDVDAMYQSFVPLQLEVLADHAELIPGTLETMADIRTRGMKVGSTTGYTREMMEIVIPEAARRGYAPDCTVCSSEVPAGRPEPWGCVQNAMALRTYPFEAMVKVDDTTPGIDEGLNAGMWTIGLTKTGNEVGLNEAEIAALDQADLASRVAGAHARMVHAGAHYVVEGIWAIPAVLDDISTRLARGERP